jgi:hypothetical protein
MPKGKSNPKLAKNIQGALRKSGLSDTSRVTISPSPARKVKRK